MKIFISWSGELSQQLGNTFKDWIPDVLQAVAPYFTPEDIQKGERWSSEIARELEESTFGIFCVTRENLSSGWMNFEAGAISKNKDKSQVCPILFGLQPTDVVGPLQQFQATVFSRDEILKLMKAINAKLDSLALTEERLVRQFNLVWPQLEESITKLLSSSTEKKNQKQIRTDRELLEEILSLVREIKKVEQSDADNLLIKKEKDYDLYREMYNIRASIGGYIELIDKYIDLINIIHRGASKAEILKVSQSMKPIFMDIIPLLELPQSVKQKFFHRLKELSFTSPDGPWEQSY